MSEEKIKNPKTEDGAKGIDRNDSESPDDDYYMIMAMNSNDPVIRKNILTCDKCAHSLDRYEYKCKGCRSQDAFEPLEPMCKHRS